MTSKTEELLNLFEVAISKLKDSPYTLTLNAQNNYQLVTFGKATHEQAARNCQDSTCFSGNKKEAIIYLTGIISVFSTFENEIVRTMVPEEKTYFEKESAAVSYAIERASKRGFDIIPGDEYKHRRTDGINISYGLKKLNREVNEALHIVLYKMPSGKFELTYYIN